MSAFLSAMNRSMCLLSLVVEEISKNVNSFLFLLLTSTLVGDSLMIQRRFKNKKMDQKSASIDYRHTLRYLL